MTQKEQTTQPHNEAKPARRSSGWQPVEILEDRIMLTAEPTVTVDAPAEIPLGGDVDITLAFENTDTDVGFAPFVDLILPTTGADGDDGISLTNATFLGQAVTTFQVVFDGSGEAVHPLAVDAAGDPIIVTGTPGDTLVVFQLPFGSFAPDQTPAEIDVTLSLSDLADVDVPLDFMTRGGFALGETASNDPATDPSIVGPTFTTSTLTPALYTLTKTNNGSEEETATGPNFQRSFFIEVDVVDGQTIDSLVITDLLPNNIVYLGATITTGSGTISNEPTIGSVVPTGSDVTVNVGTVVGAAGNDVVIRVDFFINDIDADGNPVIDPTTGNDTQTVNDVSATATFTPIDPRDSASPVNSDVTTQDSIIANKSLATQKGVSIVTDNNVTGFSPGDVVLYTVDIQISDFFSFGDLVIDDLLPDGMRLDGSFTPTLTVNEAGSNLTGGTVAFAGANFTETFNAGNGETDLQFRLSDELIARGLSGGDGVLQGGGVLSGGATSVTIAYQAVVQTSYVTPNGAGDSALTQGDTLSNSVVTNGTVRDNASPTTVLGTESDDSTASATIITGELSQKEVAFINGVAVGSNPDIQIGDEVTFRVSYDLPISSVEDFVLTDFLPLPVFSVTEVTTLNTASNPGDVPPAAGTVAFGAGNSFSSVPGAPTPVLTVNAASNSFALTYGDFQAATPQASQAEFLVTVTVQDADFADGLFLTNQATGEEANSSASSVPTNAIANFVFTRPDIELTKGVIATDAAGGSFSTPVGPVAFSAPGSAGARFSGVVNSTSLDTAPIDANLSSIDAGDTVSFAIVVENTGTGTNGAFDVTVADVLPTGFTVPGGGLNLTVTDGNGNAIGFTDANAGSPGLFGDGIVLNDGPSDGSLTSVDDPNAVNGSNIAIITYDLVATNSVGPEETITNTATVSNYAAQEGGNDLAAPDLTDDAEVSTLAPTVSKVITGTNLSETGSSQFSGRTDAAIGELITYQVTYTFSEGEYQNVTLLDLGENGSGERVEILSAEVTAVGGSLSGTSLPMVNDALAIDDRNADGVNDRAQLSLGTITNTADNTSDTDDQIVIQVIGRVIDRSVNNAGDVAGNTGRLTYTGGQASNSATVDIVEPALDITKTPSSTTADAGDTITFTIDIDHTMGSSATAFDVSIIDLINDPNLSLVVGTVALSGSAAGAASIIDGNGVGDTTVAVDITQLDLTQDLQVTFDAQIAGTSGFGLDVTNTVNLDYSSAPGVTAGERSYTGSDTTTINLDEALISKTATGSSEAATSGTDLVVGETVTFDIVVTLPEGTGPVTITDQLPLTPGLLSYVSGEIVSIGSNISGSSLSVGAIPGSAVSNSNADSFDDQISLNFGNLTVAADGMAQGVNDQIVLRVVALVEDVAANENGDALSNSAEVDFGTGTASAAASVTITEPVLVIDKTPDVTAPDAGDTVTYTVTLDHDGSSTADAQDVVITDLIPTGVSLVAGSVNVTGPGTVTTGNTAGDTEVVVTVGELELSEDVTVTYEVIVDDSVAFGTTINNTASVAYDSIDGTNAAGQAGRSASDTDDASLTTPDNTTLDKVVFDTSEAATTGTDVVVGEVITYRLTAVVDEGSTTFSIVDQLPVAADGTVLQMLTGSVISVGGSITTALPGTPVITDTDGLNGNDRISFDFGAITNAGDNAVNAGDEIVVEVQAVVLDIGLNADGDIPTNAASATTSTQTLTDDEALSITEPVLVIDKTRDVAAPDAGDTVTYTVTLDHTGGSTADAQDVVITDLIPAGVNLVVGSVMVTGPGTVTTGNTVGDTEVLVTVGELGLTEDVTVTYEVVVDDSVAFGTTIDNTASVAYDSIDGTNAAGQTGRSASDTDDASFTTTANVTFEKTIASTSESETSGTSVAIGEVITYRLRAVVDEGTTVFSVVDQLPVAADGAVLQVLGASIVSIGGSITTSLPGTPVLSDTDGLNGNDLVAFDFGTITNSGDNMIDTDDEIILEVRALVVDVAENMTGDTATNGAALTFTGGSLPSSQTVTIEEPDLTLAKTRDVATPDAGDTVTFTLTLDHTGASTGSAQDVVISDPIPAGLNLVAGSVMVTGPGTVTTGNMGGDTEVVVTVGDLGLTEDVTVTYQVVVDDSVIFGSTLTNTATTTFDSINGTNADGQDGRNQALNDSVSVTTTSDATFAKTIFDTSVTETTGTDVVVGEIITYRLTTTIDEGTTPLSIVDQVPVALSGGVLQILSGSVISVGGAISTTLSGAPALSDTDGIDGADRIAFDFGTVTNAGNNLLNGDDQIVVEVRALVLDVVENQDGDTLTNNATLTFAGGTLMDDTSVDVAEAVLVVDKSVTPEGGQPGDPVTYTVTIAHDGTSTADAFDLSLVDLISDPDLSIVAGSVTATTTGTGLPVILEGSMPGDDELRVILDRLELGETLAVSFDATISNTVGFFELLPNEATLDYQTAPGTGRSLDAADTAIVATLPFLEKSVVDTDISETGDGEFTPGQVDASVGELITFEVALTLPEVTTRNVVVTDILPTISGQDIFQLVGATFSLGSNLTSALPGTIALFDTNGDGGNDQVSIDFGDVVNTANSIIDRDDAIVLTIEARLLDVPGVDPGDIVTNSASTSFDFGGPTEMIGTSTSVDVVGPALSVEKDVDNASADAGDVVTFTVDVSHLLTSTSTAFDITVTDLLPAEVTLIDGSVVLSGDGASSATVTSGNGAGDADVVVDVSSLDRTDRLLITYQAVVNQGVAAGDLITNTAQLAFDSAPGPVGRSGSETDTASFTVSDIDFAKSILTTSLPETGNAAFDPGDADVSVGELITYRLTTIVPEGITPISIIDALPSNDGFVEFVSASVSFGGNVSSALSGSVVTSDTNGDGIIDGLLFDFGDVTNIADGLDNSDDEIVIDIVGRVVDTPANTQGTTLTNTATLDFGLGTITDSVDTEIVEPALVIDKVVNRDQGDAGDRITYTLTVRHDEASLAPAYDISVSDVLGDGLSLVPGSVVLSGGGGTTAAIVSDTDTLSVGLNALPLGEELVISYTVEIDDNVRVGDELPNAASVAFDSAAGEGGRPGSDDDLVTFTIVGNPTFDKSLVDTSLGSTGTDQFEPTTEDLVVGERVTYDLIATLPEGTTTLTITDQLPVGAGVISFESVAIVLGDNITTELPGTVISVDSDGDGFEDQLTFSFGDVVNSGDNVLDDNDRITVSVTGVVVDRAVNAAGTQLTNSATADFGFAQITDTAVAEVVEPVLVINKSVDAENLTPTQIATYTLTVQHDPTSTASAADIVIEDFLDPQTTLVPGSIVVKGPDGAQIDLGNGAFDTGLRISLGELALGGTLTITYQAEVNTVGINPLVPVVNTATLAYDSAAGPGGRTAGDEGSASFDIVAGRFNRTQLISSEQGLFGRFGLDDEPFLEEALRIDPVYTGAVTPNSVVNLTLVDKNGAVIGKKTAVADAGGNWSINLPLSDARSLVDGFVSDRYFDRTRLFESPAGLFSGQSSLLGFANSGRDISIGTDVSGEVVTVQVSSDRPSFVNEPGEQSNLRTYFSPATRGSEVYGANPNADIEDVFQERAENVADRLLEAARNPTSLGTNKFNAEFLNSSGVAGR